MPSFSSSASMNSLFALQVNSLNALILFFLVSKIWTILPVSMDQTSTIELDPATKRVGVKRAIYMEGGMID